MAIVSELKTSRSVAILTLVFWTSRTCLAPIALVPAATIDCGTSEASGTSIAQQSADGGPQSGPEAKDAVDASPSHLGPATQGDATASAVDAGGSTDISVDSAPASQPDTAGIPIADGAEAGSMPNIVTCLPGATLPAGDSNHSIDFGGTSRTYLLHVPKNVAGQTPASLVLDFHGILTTSTFEQSVSGYQGEADQEGFVVAFPDGIDTAWNIGPCCTMSRSVDDVGFAKAVVADIEKAGCIDPKRVYAVGYSMGGGMAYYLACNAADVFASVAPSAFNLLIDSEEPCHPSRPITVISFRGTDDTIVPYDGGASNPPNGLNVTIHFQSSQGTFQDWAQLDGCIGSPSAPDNNGCSTYSQCQQGVEVTLCTKQGGGHDPGDPQIGWSMLKKHPMP